MCALSWLITETIYVIPQSETFWQNGEYGECSTCLLEKQSNCEVKKVNNNNYNNNNNNNNMNLFPLYE